MLKDRRVLLAAEIVKQKKLCGDLYIKMVTDEQAAIPMMTYQKEKEKLANLLLDLEIINQMIADGHK